MIHNTSFDSNYSSNHMRIALTTNRMLLITCGLVAFITLLLLAFFGQNIGSYIDSKSMRPRAIYKDIEISGYANEFDKVLLGYPNQMSNVELSVELPDNRQFLLRDLPENVAGKLLEKQEYSFKTVRPENSIDYSIGHTFLTYRNGKLHFAALTDSCPFRISPNKDGPYVKLPISRETLLEVFGEPLRWEKVPRPPSGP
jgi:hypothetical protein